MYRRERIAARGVFGPPAARTISRACSKKRKIRRRIKSRKKEQEEE
jgi:hypothetical protein